MPQVAAEPPRKATRTTILKDEVPAPPLPQSEQPEMFAAPDEPFDIFEWMTSLRPADWEHHMVYLYWRPPGQRRTGPYLDKVVEPISIDWIKKNFGGSGGGTFTLLANGPNKFVKSYDFEIEGERKFSGNQPAPAAATIVPGTQSELVSLVRDLSNRLNNPDSSLIEKAATNALAIQAKALESVPNATPPPQINLLDVVKTLKELGLIGSPQPPSILDTIKALKDLGIVGNSAAATDPLKQVEMVKNLIEAASSLRPDGEGDFKTEIVKGIVQGLPTVRQMTADLARAAEWNARAAQRSQGAGPAPASPDAQTIVGTTSAANPAIVPPPASASTAPASTSNDVAPVEVDVTGFVWDRVVGMIRHDMDGDQIAQWIAIAAPEMFDQLKAFTPGGLMSFLESNPEMKKALEGKDAFKLASHFVHFCQTGEMIDEEEEEEITEPEPAPKA